MVSARVAISSSSNCNLSARLRSRSYVDCFVVGTGRALPGRQMRLRVRLRSRGGPETALLDVAEERMGRFRLEIF